MKTPSSCGVVKHDPSKPDEYMFTNIGSWIQSNPEMFERMKFRYGNMFGGMIDMIDTYYADSTLSPKEYCEWFLENDIALLTEEINLEVEDHKKIMENDPTRALKDYVPGHWQKRALAEITRSARSGD